MSRQALVDPPGDRALGETRTRMLQLLRAADTPLSAHAVAARTSLHRNTARFHLDGLVEAGLAERGRDEANRPGRPRVLYRATTTEEAVGHRSYRLLAVMLTGLITDMVEQPARSAVQAGKAWGRYLVDRPAPSQHVDASDAVDRLTRMLDEVGFSTDAVTEPETPVLALRNCPFREIAADHRDVVCSLHLGMLQGALDEIRAPLVTENLEPFVEPSLCLARLNHTTPRRNNEQPAEA